jgi:outer membrane protein assembly factor BamB
MKPSSHPSKTPSKFFNSCAFLFVACLLLSGVSSAAPSVTLSKKNGPPTSQILVSGRGFEPNVGVDIYFDTKDEALVVTDGQGKFDKAKAYAPRQARPGQHWVTALERNTDKGAQQSFMVFTDWPQFGFDPVLSGLNPYENVLGKNNVADLDVAWTYTLRTDYPQFSNPAVWEGTVYVTFAGGTLYAFDAKTGRVLWTYSGPVAPPAVDNGIVYTQDGVNAEALDAHTGALLWSYAIDQGLSATAPTVAGNAVFLGQGVSLYALNAVTGKPIWSFTPREGLFVSAPAVHNGVVYACAGDHAGGFGACYGLDEKTGEVLWQYSVTDGAIEDGPTVAYGLVFFEEEYQGVFALDASSGSVVWHYPTGLLSGSVTVANGKAYITGDGGLLALDAYTGKLLWNSLYGGVSSTAIANGIVYSINGLTGMTIDAVDADTGDLLWTYPVGYNSIYSPAVANGWLFVPAFTASDSPYTQVYAFRLKQADSGESSSADRPNFSTLNPALGLKTLKLGTSHP